MLLRGTGNLDKLPWNGDNEGKINEMYNMSCSSFLAVHKLVLLVTFESIFKSQSSYLVSCFCLFFLTLLRAEDNPRKPLLKNWIGPLKSWFYDFVRGSFFTTSSTDSPPPSPSMSKYFPYSSPIHRPMTESSTGLPVSEPSISTGSRRESLTRQVPRPHSSTALYPPLYRQRDLQFDQPSHELFATQTKHPPLPAHRLSPWTPDRSSTYDEELFDFDEELSSLQISSRNPTLRHSRHYSRDPEPLSRDPFMIDHLPPSSSLLPREHHHQHHHQQQHHHHHFHPQNRNRGAARFNHPRTSHDQYSGRNVLPHYALKPFQVIVWFIFDCNSSSSPLCDKVIIYDWWSFHSHTSSWSLQHVRSCWKIFPTFPECSKPTLLSTAKSPLFAQVVSFVGKWAKIFFSSFNTLTQETRRIFNHCSYYL